MNIFLREMRANWRMLVGWCVFIIFFTYMGVAKFAAFYQDPAALAILDDVPAPVLQALQLNAFNMATLEGYFGVMFSYNALLVSVFGVLLGSETLTKEERDKTADFTLVLPVSRRRVLTAKLLAAVLQCLVLVLVLWGASLAFTTDYGPTPAFYGFIARTAVANLLLALIFMALGFFLASAIKNFRRASAVAIAVMMSAFFVSLISSWDERIKFLRFFTPFKYFDPLPLLNNADFNWPLLALNVAITLACLAAAYLFYQRRDLLI
jgi:ABC-2 type transport system permease protein